MNYRHAFHAGNFADVFKHAMLARILAHLKAKETPFRYLDTHAGIGLYRLDWEEARRTGEAAAGVRRYEAAPRPEPLAALFAPYDAALTAARRTGGPEAYPGSPFLAHALLRPQDRMSLAELHPEDFRALLKRLAPDRRATIREMDGWQAAKAWLPPPERRGVVLIDPPFEQPDEHERLVEALKEGHRRFATGVFALWHPLKNWREADRLRRAVAALAISKTLRLELVVDAEAEDGRFAGSGLIVVNPPWKLKEEAALMLPWLAEALRQGRRAAWKAEWLVGE